jgi:hypothetical protein
VISKTIDLLEEVPVGAVTIIGPYTGKLIIGKLSDPIKLSGSGFRFNSDKFIGIYRS